jgi:hypothetical protein
VHEGQKSVVFNALKLAKIGPIKSELQCPSTRTISENFLIRFVLGDNVAESRTFQLVSSCSQMPQDLRDKLRPNKKIKKETTRPLSSQTLLRTAASSAQHRPHKPRSSIVPHKIDLEPSEKLSTRDTTTATEFDHFLTAARLELEQALAMGNPEVAAKAAFSFATLKSRQLQQQQRRRA